IVGGVSHSDVRGDYSWCLHRPPIPDAGGGPLLQPCLSSLSPPLWPRRGRAILHNSVLRYSTSPRRPGSCSKISPSSSLSRSPRIRCTECGGLFLTRRAENKKCLLARHPGNGVLPARRLSTSLVEILKYTP